MPASSFLLGVVRNDSDCDDLWPRLPADGEAPMSELRACIEWRVSSTMRSTLRAHLGGKGVVVSACNSRKPVVLRGTHERDAVELCINPGVARRLGNLDGRQRGLG